MEPEFQGVVAHWQLEQRKNRLEALTAKTEQTPAEQVEIRDLVAQLKDQSETGPKNAII
jgi:cell division protein FtsB